MLLSPPKDWSMAPTGRFQQFKGSGLLAQLSSRIEGRTLAGSALFLWRRLLLLLPPHAQRTRLGGTTSPRRWGRRVRVVNGTPHSIPGTGVISAIARGRWRGQRLGAPFVLNRSRRWMGRTIRNSSTVVAPLVATAGGGKGSSQGKARSCRSVAPGRSAKYVGGRPVRQRGRAVQPMGVPQCSSHCHAPVLAAGADEVSNDS